MRFDAVTANIKRKHIFPSSLKEVTTQNSILKDGSVHCRKGLICEKEKLVFKRDNNWALDMSFICTDCYIYFNGHYGRVVISVADNLMGNISYNMRLVFSDGKTTDIGAIDFTRASYDIFGYPESFTVFSGAPTFGCGIYFITRQVYGGDYPDFIRVMELSKEFDNWILIDSSDIYSPAVLGYGRGESYHNAAPFGEPLRLPDPVMPESKNLLGAGFKAYYTSDSASYAFALPYTTLDNELVKCEFVLGRKNYVWKIFSDCTSSDAVSIDGKKITMHCDRSTGRVHFTDVSTVWAPPYTGELNNLCFTAHKTVEGHSLKVASMTKCCRLDGDAMTEGSNISVFYASSLYPSQIVTNSPHNPLYFPESGQITLGEASKEITRLIIKDRQLIAFKENEMYSADIKPLNGKSEIVSSLKAAENSGVYPISFKKAVNLISSPLPKSIALLGSDIIYASPDGNIYKVSGNTSYKTEKLYGFELSVTAKSFALIYDGVYLLIDNKNALMIEKNNDVYTYGEWNFPAKILNGFSYLGDTVLFAEYFENNEYFIYPMMFSGNTDHTLKIYGNTISLSSHPIKAGCTVPLFEKSPERKRLFSIRANGKGSELLLTVCDRNKPLVRTKGCFKNNSSYFLCGCYTTEPIAKLNFSGGFVLDSLAVEYKSLNKL